MHENTKKPSHKRGGKWIAAALIAVTGLGAFGGTAHAAPVAQPTPQVESVVVAKSAKPPVTNAFGVRW